MIWKKQPIANQLATLNSNMQSKNTLYIAGSSMDATQTFNIANKGYTNPAFLLSVGYSTKYLIGIVVLNSMNESNIVFQKLAGTESFDVANITYENGLITVTFTTQPYRTAQLMLLNK